MPRCGAALQEVNEDRGWTCNAYARHFRLSPFTLSVVPSFTHAACMAASSVLVVPLEPRKPAWPGVLPATGCSHHRGVAPCCAATLGIMAAPPRSAAAAVTSGAWYAGGGAARGVARRLAGAAVLGSTTVGPDNARLVRARRRLWTSRSYVV